MPQKQTTWPSVRKVLVSTLSTSTGQSIVQAELTEHAGDTDAAIDTCVGESGGTFYHNLKHTIVGGPRWRAPRPPSRLLVPGDPRLLFANLGTSPSPRTPLTAEEKAEIWDDLLERSDRAGGTIHLWGQEPLMSEMRLTESRLSNYTEDQLIMCNMRRMELYFLLLIYPFCGPRPARVRLLITYHYIDTGRSIYIPLVIFLIQTDLNRFICLKW